MVLSPPMRQRSLAQTFDDWPISTALTTVLHYRYLHLHPLASLRSHRVKNSYTPPVPNCPNDLFLSTTCIPVLVLDYPTPGNSVIGY
ncbi:hypothetical protein J6590_036961 [Homalodisca vitripennis]|nr:hypothetical protein J6590_036961 [Homalodisca vitripennis]